MKQKLMLTSTIIFIGMAIISHMGKLENHAIVTIVCFAGALVTACLAFKK